MNGTEADKPDDAGAAQVPEGFAPVARRAGAFLDAALGPLYRKNDGEAQVFGLRIGERHLNSRGIAHGGMLATLADTVLGIALATSRTPPIPMVTVSLTTDFADAARDGDWVEARVDIQKIGTRLAFANCFLAVGPRRILRASGVFAVVAPAKRSKTFEG
ncbi:MAG TPA: PaaI family thioesterase [Myxococcales bacterium]|nr:PaaI family thioesterase [Myxococcales bacterium]